MQWEKLGQPFHLEKNTEYQFCNSCVLGLKCSVCVIYKWYTYYNKVASILL